MRQAVVASLVLVAALVATSPLQSSTIGDAGLTVVPKPTSTTHARGAFTLTSATRIVVESPTAETARIGRCLARHLRPATGFPLPVAAGGPEDGALTLALGGATSLGPEGYELSISARGVRLVARRPAGLFHGVQTIRQLLPPAIERTTPQTGPWTLHAGRIRDVPRFAWRGLMLDVARHFFGVNDVERLIDVMALYKLNRLHLHLTDDQGWRLAIHSWPRLATVGGRTEVGGGRGGYYTQAQYAAVVAYAQRRYVTIVPEIDLPGHTTAALVAYPQLACDGVRPAADTGIGVRPASLCVDRESTYRFVSDVVGELAALTPGPYLHIGGDEASAVPPAGYARFVHRAEEIVRATGKEPVGWEEIGAAKLSPGTVVQHWYGDGAAKGAAQGAKVIMSPATRTYLDMKYDASTRLGLTWAGYVDVRDAYGWDPASTVPGVSERDVLGVEAPLWTETIATTDDLDSMVFPRLIGQAEIGWSPARGRSWGDYRLRLAAQGPRLDALGVGFHRSPEVPWP